MLVSRVSFFGWVGRGVIGGIMISFFCLFACGLVVYELMLVMASGWVLRVSDLLCFVWYDLRMGWLGGLGIPIYSYERDEEVV